MTKTEGRKFLWSCRRQIPGAERHVHLRRVYPGLITYQFTNAQILCRAHAPRAPKLTPDAIHECRFTFDHQDTFSTFRHALCQCRSAQPSTHCDDVVEIPTHDLSLRFLCYCT